LLAIEQDDGVVRLEDAANGTVRALLGNPIQGRASYLEFSPDGTGLIAIDGDHQVIDVWDLRKIRKQLAELGLDWEGEPYPLEPPELKRPALIRPLEVQIVEVVATLTMPK
jgi:hypothetical protein